MERAKLILLVEDNDNDEMLALRALKKSEIPCVVDVAHDGVDALEYLFDEAKLCPDLILLDLKLPRMNGVEVLQRVRRDERTRHLPVVVFTSSNEQADIVGCFQCGANSFVRKSVDYHEYLDKVAKLAQYWLTVNEPCR